MSRPGLKHRAREKNYYEESKKRGENYLCAHNSLITFDKILPVFFFLKVCINSRSWYNYGQGIATLCECNFMLFKKLSEYNIFLHVLKSKVTRKETQTIIYGHSVYEYIISHLFWGKFPLPLHSAYGFDKIR